MIKTTSLALPNYKNKKHLYFQNVSFTNNNTGESRHDCPCLKRITMHKYYRNCAGS